MLVKSSQSAGDLEAEIGALAHQMGPLESPSSVSIAA